MFKMVFLQLGATIVAAALAAVFFGLRGGVSAALGGLSCVLPNAFFALRLHLATRQPGGASVTVFFVGEFLKIAAIVVLLVLIGQLYDNVHWGGIFIGLILALKANLFAFLVKT